MNLSEVRKEDIYDTILSDCISPGFMGMTRMIIFRDLILKTEKEMRDIQEKEAQAIHPSIDDESQNTVKVFDDTLWIQTLKKAPEGNFFLFVGNKTP